MDVDIDIYAEAEPWLFLFKKGLLLILQSEIY